MGRPGVDCFLKDKTRRNIAVFRLQGLRKEFLFFGFLDKTVLIGLFFLHFSLAFGFAFVMIFRLRASFQISETRWNAAETSISSKLMDVLVSCVTSPTGAVA